MTGQMDEALRRTAEAAARYRVPEKLVAVAAGSLESLPGKVRRVAEVDALIDAVVRLAGSHGGPHPECLTCHAVSNALAVALGIVRAETDLSLTEMLEK